MSDRLWSTMVEKTRDEIRANRVVTPAIIAARGTDGTARVRLVDGECEVRSGRLQQGVGGTVLVTAAANRSEATTAGPGLAQTTSVAPPFLWVESIEPAEYEQGFAGTGTVRITGRGFEVGVTTFGYLLEDQVKEGEFIAHPGITINSTTILDDTNADLVIVVAEDAELVDEAPFGYTNTGGIPT